MTKRKLALQRKVAWALALREGRVVRFFGGTQLTSYPTVERAQEALRLAWSSDVPAELVVLDAASSVDTEQGGVGFHGEVRGIRQIG
jgi:hypothetical protein